MRRLSFRAAAVVVAVAVAGAGCSSTQATRAPLPPPPQVVHVTIDDHHYAYDTTIHAGRTVFVGHNVGRATHTILLYAVGDDLPPVNVQIHGDKRHQVEGFAGTRVKPGATNSFAVDLVPKQRYYMLDFDRDSDNKIFALDGLDSEFRTR